MGFATLDTFSFYVPKAGIISFLSGKVCSISEFRIYGCGYFRRTRQLSRTTVPSLEGLHRFGYRGRRSPQFQIRRLEPTGKQQLSSSATSKKKKKQERK